MDRSAGRCAVIFFIVVALGVLLRCAYQMWPDSVLMLLAPRNDSVWELSKIALWPGIAAALLGHLGCRDKGSLCAYLMVPAAMPVALLFIYWFLHLVCGIANGLTDTAIWVCLLALGDAMALSIRKTAFAKQALFMVCMILFVWIFAYALFSLRAIDLPIFTQMTPQAVMAVIDW